MSGRFSTFLSFAIGGLPGIYFARSVVSLPDLVVISAGIGAISVLWSLSQGGDSRSDRLNFLLCGLLAGIAVGGWDASAEARDGDLSSRVGEGRLRGVIEGTVLSGPEPLEGGWGFEVAVETIDGDPVSPPGRAARLFLPSEPLETSETPTFVPRPGDRIEVFARLERYPARQFPGVPSDRARMRSRGIEVRGIIHDGVDLLGKRAGLGWKLSRWLSSLRLDFVRSVTSRLPRSRAAYVLAMSAGARGLLEDDQYDPFLRTGTAHLLAISGLHLGILAWMIWTLLGWLAGGFPFLLRRYGRRRVCGPPTLALLGGYVLAIGAPISAVRAFLMVTAVVVARLLVRPLDSIHALAAAMLLILFVEPAQIESLGFQLSFCATFAILWFLEHLPTALEPTLDPTRELTLVDRWRRRIGLSAGVSVSATLSTWPLLLTWMGAVPFDGIWTNVAVTPIVSLTVIPVTFAGAAVSFVYAPAGNLLLNLGGWGMENAASILEAVAAAPPYDIVTGQLSVAAGTLLAAGIFVLISSRLRPRPVVTALGVASLALLPAGLENWVQPSRVRIHFIPVGQGDATLVYLPDGRSLLVDGGGQPLGSDPGRRIVVPYLHRLGVGRLDAVVATHADVDHVGGLVAVAERLRPRTFLYDPTVDAHRLDRVVGAMATSGSNLVGVRDERDLSGPDSTVTVTKPRLDTSHQENDNSLVTRIGFAGRSALLPGDIEASAERWYLRHSADEGRKRAIDILKVPHHGSNTSSTAPFLEATSPRIGVVSAGRFNPFGHPAPEVVARYAIRGIPLLETARHGLIRTTIDSNGEITAHTVRRKNRSGF